MGVARAKGAKGKCDVLYSKIIRSIGYCERCGGNDFLQCAHVVSRRYSATRTLLEPRNAFSLCAGDHRYFTDWPREFSKFITDKLGSEHYEELKRRAEVPTKFDWDEELIRLKAIVKEKGIKC